MIAGDDVSYAIKSLKKLTVDESEFTEVLLFIGGTMWVWSASR